MNLPSQDDYVNLLTENYERLNELHLKCYAKYLQIEQNCKQSIWRPSTEALKIQERKTVARQEQQQQKAEVKDSSVQEEEAQQTTYFTQRNQKKNIGKLWGILRP